MNKAWLKPSPAWKRGPMLTADGNTTTHVYWRNGSLIAAVGTGWTMTGTVPQVAGVGETPPGAGGYSVANRYDTSAVNDSLDFAGAFTACLFYNPNGEVGSFTRILGADNEPTATQGWHIRHNAGRANFWWSAGGASVSPANTEVLNSPNVLCFGFNGTQLLAKLNLGAIVTTAVAATTPAAGVASRIGGATSSGNFTASTIYEVWASTDTPTDAAFIDLMQAVKARAGITAW